MSTKTQLRRRIERLEDLAEAEPSANADTVLFLRGERPDLNRKDDKVSIFIKKHLGSCELPEF